MQSLAGGLISSLLVRHSLYSAAASPSALLVDGAGSRIIAEGLSLSIGGSGGITAAKAQAGRNTEGAWPQRLLEYLLAGRLQQRGDRAPARTHACLARPADRRSPISSARWRRVARLRRRRVQRAGRGRHLIVTHEVTNVGSDRSELATVTKEAKTALQTEKLEVVADRGYFDGEEITGVRRGRHDGDVAEADDVGREVGRPLRQAGLRLLPDEDVEPPKMAGIRIRRSSR